MWWIQRLCCTKAIYISSVTTFHIDHCNIRLEINRNTFDRDAFGTIPVDMDRNALAILVAYPQYHLDASPIQCRT
jgi:hypothetical protein